MRIYDQSRIPEDVLAALQASIEEAVQNKVGVRVKRVEITFDRNDDDDVMIDVDVRIASYPKKKGWMFDLITTAANTVRASSIAGIPVISAGT